MNIETVTVVGSSVFAVKPAISAATGASSRPIIATMAPIAAGSNYLRESVVTDEDPYKLDFNFIENGEWEEYKR